MTDLPRRRVYLILLAFSVFVLAIGGRLVSYQALRGASLGATAREERLQDRPVPARRGTIYDSTGQVLASTMPADRLEIDLNQIADDVEFSRALAAPLAMSPQDILMRVTDARKGGSVWITLKRYLSPTQSEQIRALNVRCKDTEARCVFLTPEPRRVYPNGDFASQLLGFANWDLDGTYGVEQAYNRELGGKPGHARAEVDVHGRIIAVGQNQLDPPTDGYDATLTIDAAVQRHVEQQLEAAIKGQNASGGTAIVMDVRTGAIIALANRPSFDPNGFEQFDIGLFNNPAVSQLYEPGSTFKVLTMAIGLETGAVGPGTVFHEPPGGYLTVDKYRFTNANGATWGKETMSEVLQHSSNLGSAFVAGQVGADAFYAKLREFGIGQGTGIDLPGEEQGLVNWPDAPDWRPINLTTNAFGQGISVTPIQMVTAVAAVVNGGKLMRPYVVQELRRDGETVRRIEPRVVRQVISPQVSRQVTGMMTEVVDNVSFQYVGVPGYAIGSKSGTALIPAKDGGYEADAAGNTIGSMIGVGPAEDPRFVVYVKIDRPKKDPWGSHIAGPPTRDILKHLFTLHSIAPTRREEAGRR